MAIQLQFLGAAGTVTGSKYSLRSGTNQILLDCGLFQGFKPLRLRNWAEPPFDPAAISAVVLTHAHIDHSGYLPLLFRKGFRGRIYSSEATLELCRILLPDSARLAEEDAERANRHSYSKHKPALPLYTERDAKAALEHFVTVPFGHDFEPAPSLKARLARAGHILGASTVRVSDGRVTIAFSGDLGRSQDTIMRPPEHVARADFLVVESTYGDRRQEPNDSDLQLAQIVSRTITRGGTVIIPAFAVGRTQALLLSIARLKAKKRIPAGLPVYLNSPMAEDTTAIYHRYRAEHRLSEKDCEAMFRAAKIVNSIEESKNLNLSHDPKLSSPVAAWRPAGASCITLPPSGRGRKTRLSSQGSKPAVRAARRCWPAPKRSRFTAPMCPFAPRSPLWAICQWRRQNVHEVGVKVYQSG